MRISRVKSAASEARRFLAAIERLVKAWEEKDDRAYEHNQLYYSLPREQGAVRRASMDLTRALADLRRNK